MQIKLDGTVGDKMPETWSLDFETRSEVDLRKTGVYRYVEGDHASILCMAWKPPREEPRIWIPNRPDLSDDLNELFSYILGGGLIRAFNAEFEYVVWNALMPVPRPILAVPLLRCTMAQAAAASIRQSLANASFDVNLPQDKQKDKRGKYLIQHLCKPQRLSKKNPEMFWRYEDHPDLFHELYDYCKQDCIAEEALSERLRPLSEYEQRVWEMTIWVNERGVPLSVDEAAEIDVLVKRSKILLDEEASALSGGAFKSTNQVRLVVDWVNKRMEEF